MTLPPTPQSTPIPPVNPASPPGERGWRNVILALVAFILVPTLPQFRALIPIDNTMVLFVPALAACTVVGWWAGGRLLLAAAWVALATFSIVQVPQGNEAFYNLTRGWSLVLGGSFGLVCLLGLRRPFLPRGLLALTVAIVLAVMMSALGPVSNAEMSRTLSEELARRNAETMATVNGLISQYPRQWNDLVAKVPELGEAPAEMEQRLAAVASVGRSLYPSLLALESLVALAIAWALYHRISRARLGPPLGDLRDFRFNDQLVWGLIVGLTIIFLPNLSSVRVVGRNLLVFFGALYAVRGLGVLSWFLAPGALAVTATVGLGMYLLPLFNVIAIIGFIFVSIAAFGLGLGDTWADWRNRTRTTTTTS